MLLTLMAKSSGGGAPDVTTNFAYSNANVSNGFFGSFNTISVANRLLMYEGYGGWIGYITGKSANLYCSAGGTQPYFVSIDNGASTKPVLSGGKLPLFSGLSDTPHLVQIVVDPAFNGGGNQIPTNGNVFEVTGASPSVGAGSDISRNFQFLTDPSFVGLHSYYKPTAALPSANMSPARQMPQRGTPSGYATGGAIKIRAKAESIWVFGPDSSYYVGTDTTFPTEVTCPTISSGKPYWRKVASGLDVSNFHDYLIASNSTSGLVNFAPYMVMIAGTGAAFTALTSTKGVLQVGDSITEGRNYVSTPQGATDVYKYCAALGLMPYVAGKQGIGVAGVNTDWTAITTNIQRIPEYAVVAIGANDTAGATYRTNLTTLINNLLTAGVTKIACRVIATQYTTAREQDMIDVVASFANPNIIYVGGSSPVAGTNLWTGIVGEGADTLHPSSIGYVTYANYEVPVYTGFFTP